MFERTVVLSAGLLTLMAFPQDADAFWYARGWRGGVAVGGFRPPAVVAPYYLNGCLRCAPYYHPAIAAALAARAAAMAGGGAAGAAPAPAATPSASAPQSTTAAAVPADQGADDDAASSVNSGSSDSGSSKSAGASTSSASPGTDKASACAAGLSKDSKAIYDATASHVTSLSTLKDTVVTATRQLVMSGKIAQASAKSSAQAAGKCLELLAGN
jgi:hypothetical protein